MILLSHKYAHQIMSFCSIFVDEISRNNATMHTHFSYYEIKNFKPLKWFNNFIDSGFFFCMTKNSTRNLHQLLKFYCNSYLYKLHFHINHLLPLNTFIFHSRLS